MHGARAPAQAAAQRWRMAAEYRALEAAFADCRTDAAEPAADRAARLLEDGGWAAALLAPLVAALTADPFFEPPFRISRDRMRTAAVLFESPAAVLTASVLDAAELAAMVPSATFVFPGMVSVTRYVRAGGAVLRRWRTDPITPGFHAAAARPAVSLAPLALADGDVQRVDGRTHAQLLSGATADVVTLVFTIRSGAAPLMREHRVADGMLARVASADDRPSRAEMLLAYLRLEGRADAGAQFAEASHDPAFQLRWAAIREWLSLDARAALPRLEEMAAEDPNGEIRAAAATTLPRVRRRIAEAECRG
ncbi:hypothetical protein [Sphingomonas canadensis]|nr:hypothetical protein [Sphingomonas canadensis]